MKKEHNELSRVVSHALRHEPWLYEIELDEEGWASVDVLVMALRQSNPGWGAVSRATLAEMITSSDKRRHEMVGDRIRALYGHSVAWKLRRRAAAPPQELFHGTSLRATMGIATGGLKPMGRQYVHLSVDEATAAAVGRRKSGAAVVLKVDAAAAHAEGIVFYAGNEKVWLADAVPARFISKQ